MAGLLRGAIFSPTFSCVIFRGAPRLTDLSDWKKVLLLEIRLRSRVSNGVRDRSAGASCTSTLWGVSSSRLLGRGFWSHFACQSRQTARKEMMNPPTYRIDFRSLYTLLIHRYSSYLHGLKGSSEPSVTPRLAFFLWKQSYSNKVWSLVLLPRAYFTSMVLLLIRTWNPNGPQQRDLTGAHHQVMGSWT